MLFGSLLETLVPFFSVITGSNQQPMTFEAGQVEFHVYFNLFIDVIEYRNSRNKCIDCLVRNLLIALFHEKKVDNDNLFTQVNR